MKELKIKVLEYDQCTTWTNGMSVYFSDEDRCKNWLAKRRWPNEISCPKCGSYKIYETNRGYRCKCRYKFTVRSGTIFENSRIPLTQWFAAISTCLREVETSAIDLETELVISRNSAWLMRQKIREVMEPRPLEGKFKGLAEFDEHGLGPQWGKMSIATQERKRMLGERNTPQRLKGAIVIHCRGYRTFVFPCSPYSTAQQVKDIVTQVLDPECEVVCDGSRKYDWTGGYFRKVIRTNHKQHKFGQKNNGRHANYVEGMFKDVNHYFANFNGVSIKYYMKYWNEYIYNYDTNVISKLSPKQKFENFFNYIETTTTLTELKVEAAAMKQKMTDPRLKADHLKELAEIRAWERFVKGVEKQLAKAEKSRERSAKKIAKAAEKSDRLIERWWKRWNSSKAEKNYEIWKFFFDQIAPVLEQGV